MPSTIDFGERLRTLRLKQNLSLQQVADALGMQKGTIGNLEHSRKNPSVETLIELADFYDVSLDYLVGRSDDPFPR